MDFLYCLDHDDCRSVEVHATHDGTKSSAPSSPPMRTSNPDEVYITDAALDPEQPVEVSPHSLVINAKVYVIAEKYDIQALKEQAVAKYKEVLATSWNSSAFTESACIIYENTPETDRSLRDVIAHGAGQNAKKLLDRGEFVDLLKTHGSLAVDVLHEAVTSNEREEQEPAYDQWNFGTKKDKRKGR
jgi:hypothetical protein